MNTVILTDTFGKTDALISLAKTLNASIIIEPYDGLDMHFENENEAYRYFIEHIGLDSYLHKTQQTLTGAITLIGFSVGATTIWRCSENMGLRHVTLAVCFYGAQIRNFSRINPLFNIELIFPSSEAHFDVVKLSAILAKKRHVTVTQSSSLHGFMNVYSGNYDAITYEKRVYKILQVMSTL